MRIVLDTNVLVSGLYNPYGTPGRILDLILSGQVQLLYDDRILGEYLDVMARPQLELDSSLAQAVVQYFRLSGERVTGLPLADTTLPDSDDAPFSEIAISGNADALVTGNMKHFSALKDRGVLVLSPSQFLEKFI
jgi:putative PIN family toxin of toxin-antitoxin system